MKVVRVDERSDARALIVVDEPMLECREGEVRIKVHAAGVNRADLIQRAGKYPPPSGASTVLGLEVAGTIDAVGRGVNEWMHGERVCALLSGGGYAEFAVVPAGHVMRIPNRCSFVEAAAIPEAFITAYTNLFIEGQLEEGERVLIHGGSSGVGTAAIQLARCVGALVCCTVGNEEKSSRCHELGANLVINYKDHDFEPLVRNWSPQGVDLILDIIGKEYFARNISLLAHRGRMVVIATMGGVVAEIDLSLMMRKRNRLIGSVLRGRSNPEKSALISGFVERFAALLETGELKPIVDSVFTLEDADAAQHRMRSSVHIGKIVLRTT